MILRNLKSKVLVFFKKAALEQPYAFQRNRLQQLLWEAEERWRGMPPIEALNNLSVLILSNIVRTRRAGNSTDDLEEDYRLAIDERRRLQLEQVEMDSAVVEVQMK